MLPKLIVHWANLQRSFTLIKKLVYRGRGWQKFQRGAGIAMGEAANC